MPRKGNGKTFRHQNFKEGSHHSEGRSEAHNGGEPRFAEDKSSVLDCEIRFHSQLHQLYAILFTFSRSNIHFKPTNVSVS